MNPFFSLKGDEVFERKTGAFFVCFEGLDGSGQTTQAKMMEQWLLDEDRLALYVKEPTTDSKAALKIHAALKGEYSLSAKELQFLFSQDREIHLEKVIYPALKSGKIIIADRYFFTSFAYGSAEGVSFDWLWDINKNFIYPDLIFYLEISPQEAIKRIIARNNPISSFEKKENLEKNWKAYSDFPVKFKNFRAINGERNKEDVFNEIKNIFSDTYQKLCLNRQ